MWYSLTVSHRFLLHGRARLRPASTGQHPVPPGAYVLRRIDIGVFGVATGLAAEYRLGWPVVRADMPAFGTGLAGVMGRHFHEPAPSPLELVVELADELAPALVEYGPVQPGLGPDVPAGLITFASGAGPLRPGPR